LKPTGYTGALVYAEPGVYDNVLVLDWSELYPSLMETFHISWDTMTKIAGDIKVGNVFFSKDSPGQTNRIIKPLREYRSQIKKAMKETNNREEKSRLKLLSDALKAIINANYGVYGFHSTKGNGSRYYDPDVASAITYIGREIFNQVKTYISSIDYHMVYGDTDSIFLCLKGGEDETSRIVSGIQDHINSFIRDKYNLESKLKIASEYTMKRVIIISKKRYYGITTSGEEIIKGLEIVRMESAPVTVAVEKEVGRLILNDKASEVKDLKNAVVRRILEGKVPLEDIALRSRCTKDLKDYKTKTRNSKAVEVYKHITGKEIKKGERFYLLQILPNQKLRKEMNVKWNVNVVGVKKLSELPKDIQIDYRKMADLTVVSPVEKYIQAIQSKSYKQRNLTEYW
jgi:DNA polymerase elongation subunit (family B)